MSRPYDPPRLSETTSLSPELRSGRTRARARALRHGLPYWIETDWSSPIVVHRDRPELRLASQLEIQLWNSLC